jgi:hypothetical protein
MGSDKLKKMEMGRDKLKSIESIIFKSQFYGVQNDQKSAKKRL